MYEKLKNEKGAGGSGTSSRARNQTWADIRLGSILDFVNRVAGSMTGESNPARQDKNLRAGLYDMALTNGQGFFWQGMEVDERMVLIEWAKTFRRLEPGELDMFRTRAEWDDFCEAMRKVRDPNVSMTDRPALLRWGAGIEALQRPHAERMGWT